MINYEIVDDGILLPVKAQAAARENRVRGEHDGLLRVAVTQVAEKGKANQAIIDVLAKWLTIKKSQIELVSGETNAQKKFLLHGCTEKQLNERLQSLVS